jgi:tetratricopeptide (TPR) repeat protein
MSHVNSGESLLFERKPMMKPTLLSSALFFLFLVLLFHPVTAIEAAGTDSDARKNCGERLVLRMAALAAQDWDTLVKKAIADIAYCQRVYQDDPSPLIDMYEAAAFAYNQLKKYDDSIAVCDDGIKISQKEPGLYLMKARALLNLGRRDEAITNFELAKKLAISSIEAGEKEIQRLDGSSSSAELLARKEELQSRLEFYASLLKRINELKKASE